MTGLPPDDAGRHWMTLMRQGAWDEAWRLSDAALAARDCARDWSRPRHLQAVWDGTKLAGRRVLVRCYHGLGDTIQFVRLVPLLQESARCVTVWSQPSLLPLLATLRDPPALLPLHDGAPDVDYDVDIEIMEIPHALRLSPGTVPARVPYLHPPPPPPPSARSAGLRVGLVWAAGEWNPRRSVPVELLQPIGAIPGVTLLVLQRGPALAQRPEGFGIVPPRRDVLQLATLMRGLDLVVSVDSMPAHLAGALGVPVWLLLARDADWRWMEGRDDNPWYPTMRLFRQAREGDWSEPVRRLFAALQALAARSVAAAS